MVTLLQGFECINTHGSFICRDVDECQLKTFECDSGEKCQNVNGGYDCINPCGEFTCKIGLKVAFDGKECICEDYDECAETDVCPVGHKCVNSIGSFSCQEFDECSESPCGSGQDCHNIIGSYECRVRPCAERECEPICDDRNLCYCLPGYKKMQNRCIRVNPCIQNNGGCEHNCEYQYGAKKCSCKRGFELGKDGKSCQIIQFELKIYQQIINKLIICIKNKFESLIAL